MKRMEESILCFISSFRNNLKSGLNGELVIQVHQGVTKVSPFRILDIVRHDGATGGTVRPEPNKRNPFSSLGQHYECKHSLHQGVYRKVYGPFGKGDLFPSAQVDSLEISP